MSDAVSSEGPLALSLMHRDFSSFSESFEEKKTQVWKKLKQHEEGD